MTPLLDLAVPPDAAATEADPHILIVIKDVRARFSVARLLLDAGYRVTTSATYGAVELVLAHAGELDLLVTTQSFGEMGQFGLPQLVRSVEPELPIVVLESEAAHGAGVISAVRDAIRRWPLRDRSDPPMH